MIPKVSQLSHLSQIPQEKDDRVCEMKRSLRREAKEWWNSLSPEEIERSSELVCQHILQSELYQKAEKISLYLASDSEISLDTIIDDALEKKKEVGIPAVARLAEHTVEHRIEHIQEKNEMRFDLLSEEAWTAKRFTLNRFALRELEGERVPFRPEGSSLLILVPGLLFGERGERLGRGGGFYDRYFSTLTTNANFFALGITHSAMIREGIPMEEHDRSVDGVCTERGSVFSKATFKHPSKPGAT